VNLRCQNAAPALHSGLTLAELRATRRPDTSKRNVWTPSLLGASGNIYSSVSELLRWNGALHHGRVLQASSYAELVAPRLGNYGLGVAVSDKPFGKAINHTGSHVPQSTSAILIYVPGHDLSLAGVARST
jgi:Beta-lactamase